ncbi:MAG: hypothetical protein ACYTGH_15060 [Planctomycetota bacterium]
MKRSVSGQSERSDSRPEPEYDENGVDVGLIRWMLAKSPRERLQYLQENVRSVMRLRDHVRPA